MEPLFGLETEYGITVAGAAAVDVVAESIALVRSYMADGALMKWDYAREDPHRDARGFRAKELLQDTDESAYFEIDRNRPLSFQEIKSDLVLANGARFYNDHAHPEYATPECTSVRQLVAHEKAGERILAECARRRARTLEAGERVLLYKNNTDFVGHSYGCHDNYLIPRAIPWAELVRGMVPFLVTRQIFAGAGKLGLETESATGQPGIYQISQRADFFSVLVSIDTMNKRPLINTRDEPHANANKYRRFHVILGDSNMSEWATALKVGTTALVLQVMEQGKAPAVEMAQPLAALQAISRDPAGKWKVELADGRTIPAIALQRLYLEAARGLETAQDEETAWLLREWECVLDDLERDPNRAADRIDWVAKKNLLDALREAEGLTWSDPWLQAIDLEYHNIFPEEGLYFDLLRQGTMRRVVEDEEVEKAMRWPPETTRAFFRGRAVAKYGRGISALQWDEIVFREGKRARRVLLAEPRGGVRLAELNQLIRAEMDFVEFFDALQPARSRPA